MRYYEGHEYVYRRLRANGHRSWDERGGHAPDYDSFCLKPFIEDALARTRLGTHHPRTLEIGCGTGPACCLLARRGHRVEGLDVSPTAIAMAREEAKARDLAIDFRVADICHDALLPDTYDLVVDGHCLHCLATDEDRRSALDNVRSGLCPGGQLWVETMLALPGTHFADRCLFDANGTLWVKLEGPAGFDLEKEVEGVTYVANRRLRGSATDLDAELAASGFTVTWSNIVAPVRPGEPADYRAICSVS